jgi:hypothetical protein
LAGALALASGNVGQATVEDVADVLGNLFELTVVEEHAVAHGAGVDLDRGVDEQAIGLEHRVAVRALALARHFDWFAWRGKPVVQFSQELGVGIEELAKLDVVKPHSSAVGAGLEDDAFEVDGLHLGAASGAGKGHV